jgi:uncharacterized membrane protein (Fun14 family)
MKIFPWMLSLVKLLIPVSKSAVGTGALGIRPPWKAKSLWAAMAMALVGGGFYLNSYLSPISSTQVDSSGSGGAVLTQSAPDQTSQAGLPLTLRLGVSYMSGFLVGWVFRRFIRLSILLSTGALGLVALGRKLGWIDLDWTLMEGHVHHATAWVQGGAGALKDFLEGLLPSAGSAGVGVLFGFRRK